MRVMERETLASQLQDLHDGILRMGVLVQEALRKALFALEMRDYTLAQEIIAADATIDAMELAMDELSARIVVVHRPDAADLRELLTTAKITTALERIGDHARHIADKARIITDPLFAETMPVIREMLELDLAMLQDFLTAYVERDSAAAREVAARDDQIDALHRRLSATIVRIMRAHPESLEKGIELVLVNRFLERFGDQITNMCEWVVFTTDADHVELN